MFAFFCLTHPRGGHVACGCARMEREGLPAIQSHSVHVSSCRLGLDPLDWWSATTAVCYLDIIPCRKKEQENAHTVGMNGWVTEGCADVLFASAWWVVRPRALGCWWYNLYLQLARIACDNDITANPPFPPPGSRSGNDSMADDPLIAATYAAQRYQPPSLAVGTKFHA
jgi:hypothetical protein